VKKACKRKSPWWRIEKGKPTHHRDSKDKDLVYRVLEKKLRITDRAILDASYAIEMKVMEPRLELKAAAIQPMIEEVAKTNPRANEMKPQDLMDRRYLAEMESSGFFNQVWNEKR
jgi:hypothetical protein